MIFIRTDSNNEVATGHVMRCMTIADKLIKYGEKVKFIVKDVDTVNLLDGKFEYINIPIDNIRTIYDEILYIKYIVNNVLLEYGALASWKLSDLSHREISWLNSRSGLKDGENGSNIIQLADIQKDSEKVRPYDHVWDMYYDEFEDLDTVE